MICIIIICEILENRFEGWFDDVFIIKKENKEFENLELNQGKLLLKS